MSLLDSFTLTFHNKTIKCNGRDLKPVLLSLLVFPPSFQDVLPCSAYVLVMTHEEVFKSLLEGGITKCIAGRVDGAVDVTEPVTNCPHSVGDTGCTEGVNEHHDIVWGPGDDESQQNRQDRPSDFLLPGRRRLLFGRLLSHLHNLAGYNVLFLISILT